MMPSGAAACTEGPKPARRDRAKPHPRKRPHGATTRLRGAMRAPLWLVIPTYNEAANVEPIVRAALAELARLGAPEHRVLVVDDNSPDGTGAIVDALASELEIVEVLH